MRIEAALKRFVVQLRANGRSPHTVNQYRRHIGALAAWAGPRRALEDLSHQNVAAFMAAPAARVRPDGGLKKANSVNALRTSVRMFFAYARDTGWIRQNPARLLRPAICGRPLPRALTEEESSRLIAAIAHPRDHALFATLLGTGIRIGSALALDVGDLDLERGELLLRRAKGDRVERVYVCRAVREILGRFVGARTAGPVFAIGARHAHRRLVHWLAVAGITRPASPHSLRHSFATHLLKKSGGDIMLVQKALRHRNIESTLRYAALDDRRVREAIEG